MIASFSAILVACGGEDSSDSEESNSDGDAQEETSSLTVYSPHQTEIINPIVNEFQDQTGISVDLITAGTGELLNRVEAESGNPLGDVFWGGGAESLERISEYFTPYVTSEDEHIPEEFKSPTDSWTGFSALPMVIMYNESMVDEADVPTSWEDLLDPKWEGEIAYADPSSSGSSYTQVVTMLFAFEDDGNDGWNYVEDFIEQLDGNTLSGSSMVYQGVSDGEFPIGVTLEEAAYRYIVGDAPVGISYPSEGTSAVPDGMAIIEGANNQANAEAFLDFLAGEEVQEMATREFNRRTVRDDVDPPEGWHHQKRFQWSIMI
ncbi:LOW QUALITY PROTEIN: ferric iron ABC transporter, iron-binding protein [Geomicrobium sp. JCM 19037]|nr:LOW QUALITY PROTEIN: ferric iron ABC transporter, iron-binding protein [Geomicrobium sp. JCM 19037]